MEHDLKLMRANCSNKVQRAKVRAMLNAYFTEGGQETDQLRGCRCPPGSEEEP